MFDYLNRFNDLSSDLKSSVSSPEVLKVIEDLELEYGVELASLIMRVMVKDVSIEMLPLTLFTEFRLGQEKSESLAKKLENEIFFRAGDYLGILPLVEKKIIEEPKPDSLILNKQAPEKTTLKKSIKPESSANLESIMELDDSKKTSEIVQDEKTKSKISPVAEEIFSTLNLKFNEESKKDKFLSLLDKYLRGVKDRFSVRQVFTENLANGGFGLTDKMVDNIFVIAQEFENKEYLKVKEGLKVNNDILEKINKLSQGQFLQKEDYKGDVPVSAPDSTSLLAPLVPAVVEEAEVPMVISDMPEKVKGKLEEIKKSMDKIDLPEKTEKPIEKSIEKPVEKPIEKLALEKQAELRPMVGKVAIKPDSSGKIKMTDIRKVKTTGPIDELKYMDLLNFRRVSDNPEETFKNISQKLKVLEEMDYSKMLEGIKAWRQSPVNQLYLKIFSKASEEGLGINKIIDNLRKSNQDYLSREEIDALLKFNKSLVC